MEVAASSTAVEGSVSSTAPVAVLAVAAGTGHGSGRGRRRRWVRRQCFVWPPSAAAVVVAVVVDFIRAAAAECRRPRGRWLLPFACVFFHPHAHGQGEEGGMS